MCECINRTWHAVIKESDTLQEKLFYKCDLVTLSEDMDESDLEINPFFLLVQRRGLSDTGEGNMPTVLEVSTTQMHPGRRCTFLDRRFARSGYKR